MIDCISSASKYRAHLDPVWAALPAELRGSRYRRDVSGDPPLPSRAQIALVAGYMDMRAARRSGYRRIALLEHGIGQSYSSDDAHLPGGSDRDPVGLFLSPNEHAAARDRARYPAARVDVVGSPILDGLPDRVGDRGRVVAVTWHWDYTRIPEMRSAFAHFRAEIANVAAAFEFIGHAHPQAATAIAPVYKQLGVRYEPDYSAVFREADVLVADNTSAIFEFASTGRPVVVLNDPNYRRDVEHGLRFWEAAEVGINVWSPSSLVPLVIEALEDHSSRQIARDRALDVVYTYRSGAGARAAAALQEWIQ